MTKTLFWEQRIQKRSKHLKIPTSLQVISKNIHILIFVIQENTGQKGFPGGPVVKNLPCNAGDIGLIPGAG